MKLRCLDNTGKNLPEDFLSANAGYNRENEFPLIKGKDYIVYAVTDYIGGVWYYLCDEDYAFYSMSYPIWYPSPLFEMIDSRLSCFWRFDCYKENSRFLLSFKEWVEDIYYYENLIDGEPEAVSIFQKYKKAIDAEANIEDDVSQSIDWLSKPVQVSDEYHGWHKGSQTTTLKVLKDLKADLKKRFWFDTSKYSSLIDEVRREGVDTGELYELLNKVSQQISDLNLVES